MHSPTTKFHLSPNINVGDLSADSAAEQERKLSESLKSKNAPLPAPPQTHDTFAATYNPAGNMLCLAGMDATIRVFHVEGPGHVRQSSVQLTAAMGEGRALRSAVTSLNFRPEAGVHDSAARNILLVTTSDGGVSHWHLGSSRLIHATQEEGTQTLCASYSPSGQEFVTGGKDAVIRVYDSQSMKQTHTFVDGMFSSAAHTNRVQALRYIDTHTLLSGGWDNTMQVWDVRQARSVNHIYGPYLCGSGIDTRGNHVVTASTRNSNQLEVWDIRTWKSFGALKWPMEMRVAKAQSEGVEVQPTNLYTVKFSPNGKWLAAGGSHDARVFDAAQLADMCAGAPPPPPQGDETLPPIGALPSALDLEGSAVFAAAWSPNSDCVAMAGTHVRLGFLPKH